MSHAYRAVQWNKHKKVYDLLLAGGVGLYLVVFVVVSSLALSGDNGITPMTLLIRAFGTAAIILLHLILCIGPLARLWPGVFAPLLYNRRHMGVTMFILAFLHAALATLWYHGFGVVNPIVSIFTSNGNYDQIAAFPFQPLGFIALLILFLMAATSHDFWLANLGPRTWKTLHTLVYVAYALLVMHVVLGALQSNPSVLYIGLLVLGFVMIAGLHLITGWREWRKDAAAPNTDDQEWIDVADVNDIEDGYGKVVTLAGSERIAVLKYDGKVSAVSNVCAHQHGPLGEGKVVDGCLTCPWHGYQYLPHNGQSPPPFTEKIPTYRVSVQGSRILVNPEPLPPGTAVEPATIEASPPPESNHEA
ncbi:ferric reductase-like transmembrane domain-containing protein [Algisphaera agarilytica]|uniref:DMSO/TMAO reductase YedYZ heme-binding membrane subunit n=1 Tax=Algisphaera agarilytica TaxID=1385975 RepID=A0A7X0LLR6_9BACT|nr:ferric reductase-like transmembrane domain-containing protein [Algisphaera agarilytica]MBB6431297.1 DMSO/TMAO reductase YedYZ heme-binding membrane subunit [Algisphaera agarilytica]